MKEVDLYEMERIAGYANDTDPNANIERMLKACSKMAPDNPLILCHEFNYPMLVEDKEKIHVFDILNEPFNEILKRVPTDSFWSKLIGKTTITVTPEEISKLASEKEYSPQYAAEKILGGYLRQHEKDIAIFYNNMGKLVAFVISGSRGPTALVETNSFPYSKSDGTITET